MNNSKAVQNLAGLWSNEHGKIQKQIKNRATKGRKASAGTRENSRTSQKSCKSSNTMHEKGIKEGEKY